jgi:hypothetical protein
MNQKVVGRIFGMTRKQFLILMSMGGLFVCVVLLFGAFFIYNESLSFFNAPLPMMPTAIQVTNSPIPVNPSDTPSPQPTFTTSPTLLPTETPVFPISFTYEGVAIDCICNNCYCLTNQSFTVKITIDAQGNVTGVFEKYIPELPDIELTGTKTNIFGSYRNGKDYNEFTGTLSDDLGYLNATLAFEGADYSGKRVLLLYRK